MKSPGRRPVLVADDEDEFRSVLREYLEQCGHEVLEAANGLEALWAIKHKRCAVVVLDLSMPRLGGLDVIPQIQKFDPSICIIVVTAHATGEIVARLEKLGVPVLSKPVALRPLGALVAEACARVQGSTSAGAGRNAPDQGTRG